MSVEMRACGSSGLTLPSLGLGCWAFGGGQYWGAQSQSDVEAVVHAALDAGVTYFDTAEGYNDGASERSLGAALAGRREQAIIGSKISPHNARPELVRAHCEASLRRLGTDHIDLYMVHWPFNASSLRHFTEDPSALAHPPLVAEAFSALDRLRQEGKVRFLGVSNFGVRQLAEVLASGVPIAADELPYNLLMRACELELLPACARAGVGVLGYMGLMQGLLGGRFTSFDDVPAARTRTRHFAGTRPGSRHGEAGIERETAEALHQISAVAADLGAPVSELALAWALHNPAMSCSLVGCRNVQQLQENLRATELRLTSEVMAHLDRATDQVLSLLGTSVDYYQSRADSRSA
jgi:myo-inositol catabolism protein IolS